VARCVDLRDLTCIWCFSCPRLKVCGFACLRVLGFDGLDCVRLPAFGHICCQVAILVLGCSCGLGHLRV